MSSPEMYFLLIDYIHIFGVITFSLMTDYTYGFAVILPAFRAGVFCCRKLQQMQVPLDKLQSRLCLLFRAK